MFDINLAGSKLHGNVADVGKHIGEKFGKDFVNAPVIKGLSVLLGIYVGFKIIVGLHDTFYPSRIEHDVKHVGNVIHVSHNRDDAARDGTTTSRT